jgi:CubicO group peptidase (beta-lactamase class C family)
MKRQYTLIIIGLIYLNSQQLFGQIEIKKSQVDNVKEIIDSYESLGSFNGNILVAKGDSILLQRAIGNANFEYNILNNIDTKFRLASLSKQFTAAAIVLLEQQGKLKLNDPVSAYLRVKNDTLFKKIKVHQLLSHSSGLLRDIESLSHDINGKSFVSINQLIQLISKSELAFNPGDKYSYSNLGYNLAAAIIESVTEKSYGEALHMLIFKPLKMSNTAHEINTKIISNKASGYVGLPDGIVKAGYEEKSYVTGAGTIYSTINDLYLWSRALLDGSLISKSNVEKMFSKKVGRYGYGWFVDDYKWNTTDGENIGKNINHEGGSPGFESQLTLLIEHNITIIVLSNKLPSNLYILSDQIKNTLLGFEKPIIRPKQDQLFYSTMFTKGINATKLLIQNWKETDQKYLIPGRFDILLVGRGYIDSNNFEKAKQLFDYLISAEPKWVYPVVFKGILMENFNRNKEALELYNNALKLDANEAYSKNRIKELLK